MQTEHITVSAFQELTVSYSYLLIFEALIWSLWPPGKKPRSGNYGQANFLSVRAPFTGSDQPQVCRSLIRRFWTKSMSSQIFWWEELPRVLEKNKNLWHLSLTHWIRVSRGGVWGAVFLLVPPGGCISSCRLENTDLHSCCSQCGLGPAAVVSAKASPASLLEMQDLSPHCRPTESKLHLTRSLCTIQFEKPHSQWPLWSLPTLASLAWR